MLGAHFLRAGAIGLVVVCLGAIALLFYRRVWVVHVFRLGMPAAAGIWIHTAVELVEARRALGEPWLAAAGILFAAAALTAAGPDRKSVV